MRHDRGTHSEGVGGGGMKCNPADTLHSHKEFLACFTRGGGGGEVAGR